MKSTQSSLSRQKNFKHTTSNLPLKMLFLTYINKHSQKQLITDCYYAVNNKIQQLSNIINQNYQQISEISGDKKSSTQSPMDIIEEQATDRSRYHNEEILDIQITRNFNRSIQILQNSEYKLGDIFNLYKKQLISLAKDLKKESENSKRLSLQNEQLKNNQKKQERSISNLKSAKRSASIASPSLASNAHKSKNNKISHNKSKSIDNDQQVQQIREAPKPFCQQCRKRENKQNQRQQNFIQKAKWRQLSTKITNLKQQLTNYEEQLIEKQSQIKSLTQKLSSIKQTTDKEQSEERRKLKTISTTLRGEKIVLQNQISSLKKKNKENEEYLQVLEMDNKKMKMEKDNLDSTIQWHLNTIQDLRKNFSNGLKDDADLVSKLTKSQKSNKIMLEQIQKQEKYLQDFMTQLQQIQTNNQKIIEEKDRRINDLEEMIDQKNQVIIKMKLQSRGTPSSKRQENFGTITTKTLKRQKQSNFQADMVKVLNKRLTEKDFVIERLQIQNLRLKQQIDLMVQYNQQEQQ